MVGLASAIVLVTTACSSTSHDATTPGTTPTTTTSQAAPSALERVHPRQITAFHQGQRVWAVFVGVGASAHDPKISRAKLALNDVGYVASGDGEVGCADGAAAALGVPSSAYVVDVDFARRTDAVAFRDAFVAATRPATIVVARISVGCVD